MGEEDVKNYRKECIKERKNSLEFRNAERLRHCQIDNEIRLEKIKSEHDNYELKWAGEEDVENYKKECIKERKTSLEFRNAERLRHCQIDNERRLEKIKSEHDNYELKWAGEEDVKNYR